MFDWSSAPAEWLSRCHNTMHNDAMERTTIMADPEVLDRLRSLARDRGVSLAEVVREALEEKAGEYRPKPRSLGIGASGRSDTASTVATEPVPPASWH